MYSGIWHLNETGIYFYWNWNCRILHCPEASKVMCPFLKGKLSPVRCKKLESSAKDNEVWGWGQTKGTKKRVKCIKKTQWEIKKSYLKIIKLKFKSKGSEYLSPYFSLGWKSINKMFNVMNAWKDQIQTYIQFWKVYIL